MNENEKNLIMERARTIVELKTNDNIQEENAG
jgi:hypothetical protein